MAASLVREGDVPTARIIPGNVGSEKAAKSIGLVKVTLFELCYHLAMTTIAISSPLSDVDPKLPN